MAPIPPLRYGLQSKTFKQPPLDETLTFPAICEWHGTHCRDHPFYKYEDTPGSFRTLVWGEVIQGIQRATRLVRKNVGIEHTTPLGSTPPIVAIFASADTITYNTLMLGILRAGMTAFCISPRNSAIAVGALLTQTNVSHVFVSTDEKVKSIIDSALKDLPEDYKLSLHEMPVFEDFFVTSGIDSDFTPEPLVEIDMDAPAAIYHSSGTTSLPKPITFTHRALVRAMAFTCYGEVDLAGEIIGCHALPIFHGMGMLTSIFTAATGSIVAAFKPQSPPIVPNPNNVLEAVVSSKCDYVMIAPTFVETWSQSQDAIEKLSRMKGVIFGGGPLSKQAGDRLVSSGVTLYTLYGLTQVICVTLFLPRPPGMDWEYFPIPEGIREYHFIDQGNNEYELVSVANENFRPNVINFKVDGRDAFATSDLVTPHPTKKGYWKVVGRTDDQIMHSTGEKTNPGPLENMLMHDPHVKGAVMFGRGRFYCGVLVEPKEEYAFDPSDTNKLAEFRNLIWPTIENMNAFAPSHSRLFKEMIGVASPSKPFTYTPKGTLQRQKILNNYEKEIDALYAAVDENTHTDIDAPKDWSIAQTKTFVRTIIEKVMKSRVHIADTDDLFERGLDSLQATWIRNSILGILKEKNASAARKLSQTFIYDNPTIEQLSIFLSSIVLGSGASEQKSLEIRSQELFSLVEKYSKDFPSFEPRESGREKLHGDVVLLTGGTGSLGSNILEHLLNDSNVSRVYAMSRPSDGKQSIKERYIKAFERESIDVELLESDKIRFVEGDASETSFGVDNALFTEMQNSVTHVIHNAWRVNFNVAVASFESNIRSVRNFIDFCLRCPGTAPARLVFISSVGVFLNYNEKKFADEDYILNPQSAIGLGYGESKWVSEMILRNASLNTPISTTIVRCGQMTGGVSGAWNEHEWFPSLIKSSVTLGKLPDAEGVVCWVSCVDAAGAVVDFLHAKDNVVNLVHPRPVTWSSVMTLFSKYLNLPVVPFSEWMSDLKAAHKELDAKATNPAAVKKLLDTNPALRLMSFFETGEQRSGEPFTESMGIVRLDCSKAVAASKTLSTCGQVGEESVRRWVSHWKETGFLA